MPRESCLVAVAAAICAALVTSLSGCGTPDFIKRATRDEPANVAEPVNVQVTPRELLTARLVNPPANENTPPITVGKLIEFADRYLSCDCSGTRFVRRGSVCRTDTGLRRIPNKSTRLTSPAIPKATRRTVIFPKLTAGPMCWSWKNVSSPVRNSSGSCTRMVCAANAKSRARSPNLRVEPGYHKATSELPPGWRP